jgi:hypothetical protein
MVELKVDVEGRGMAGRREASRHDPDESVIVVVCIGHVAVTDKGVVPLILSSFYQVLFFFLEDRTRTFLVFQRT